MNPPRLDALVIDVREEGGEAVFGVPENVSLAELQGKGRTLHIRPRGEISGKLQTFLHRAFPSAIWDVSTSHES